MVVLFHKLGKLAPIAGLVPADVNPVVVTKKNR